MIKIERTTSANKDFIELVKLLDADLKIRDGEDHAFYAQFNKTAMLNNVIVAYLDEKAVACGAFREYTVSTIEIKRMYVLEDHRRKGLAQEILKALETWAAELNYADCILETGKNQPEAIRLYQKYGFQIITNYGQYQNIENSVCMKKDIRSL